jgi:hypothetical protein
MRRGIDGRMLLIPGVSALVAIGLMAAGTLASRSVAPAPLEGTHASVNVVATAPPGISSRVAAVAVGATVSALRTDPDVIAAAAGKPSGRTTTIAVLLRTDDAHEAAGAIRRIQGSVDPGPLHLTYDAAALTLDRAQSSVRGQIAKLELLIAPVVVFALVALLGSAGGLTALIAAAIGFGAALLAISLTGGFLLAVAPAAAVAIAQATELSGLHVTITRGAGADTRAAVPESVLYRWLPAAAASAAVRGLGPLALLATSFDGAGSIAVASAVAALLASVTVLVVSPSMTALLPPRPAAERRRSRPARAAFAITRALARSGRLFAGVAAAAVLAGIVLAVPARDAATTPLAAAGAAGGGVLDGIGVAALLFGLGVASVLAIGHRLATRLRLVPAAALALLPPAAAVGILTFCVQQGNLGGLAGERPALVGGAVAVCLVAVGALAGGRCALVARTALEAGEPGIPTAVRAQRAAALATPGVLASTAMLVGCFGVLCAADLGAAREVGLGVAAGATGDLVLVRMPFLGVLARWGQ